MSSSERSGDADATPDNARATQEDAETASSDAADRLRESLDLARTRRQPHAVALAGATALGLVLAWVHWLGLVLGGALVALVAPSIRRGVAYALAFGVLVLVAFAVAIGDAALLVPEMRPIVYVTVGAAIGLPLFGSLARGIV